MTKNTTTDTTSNESAASANALAVKEYITRIDTPEAILAATHSAISQPLMDHAYEQVMQAALWQFKAAVKSAKQARRSRDHLDRLRIQYLQASAARDHVYDNGGDDEAFAKAQAVVTDIRKLTNSVEQTMRRCEANVQECMRHAASGMQGLASMSAFWRQDFDRNAEALLSP